MQLLVEIEVEITPDALVLRVESVADNCERLSQVLQLAVVVRLHNEVVILELVEVECVLHHLGILRQRALKILRRGSYDVRHEDDDRVGRHRANLETREVHFVDECLVFVGRLHGFERADKTFELSHRSIQSVICGSKTQNRPSTLPDIPVLHLQG